MRGLHTEAFIRTCDLVEGHLVKPCPGALDDRQPTLCNDVAIGGAHWLRSLWTISHSQTYTWVRSMCAVDLLEYLRDHNTAKPLSDSQVLYEALAREFLP